MLSTRRTPAASGAHARKSSARLALALALCGAAAAPAHAQFVRTSGDCSKVVGGGLPFDPGFTPRCPGGTWVDERPGTTSTAGWAANAGFGIYQVTASSSLSNVPPLGTPTPLAFGVGASGTARSNDTLTLDVPGLTGQRGLITASMRVDGFMVGAVSSPLASTSASWALEAQVVQGGTLRGGGSASGEYRIVAGVPGGESFVDRLVTITAEVVIGTPFVLDIQLRAAASATVRPDGAPGTPTYLLPVTASSNSNFGNTALWNGVQSITLANGTVATNWTLGSLSGTPYALPVPEPAAWLSFAAGLLAIGALVRHRRPG